VVESRTAASASETANAVFQNATVAQFSGFFFV
jgi:hypothetical protein